LWQNCRNWEGDETPDSLTSVVVASGRRLYIGNNITAYCKNITVNAGGFLNIAGGTLRVYGKFENNGSFTHTGDSVMFVGNTTGRIKGTGTSTTFYNLYLNKTNATDSIIVTNNPTISNSMNFTKGVAHVSSSNYILFNSGSSNSSSSANSYVDGAVRKVGATDFIFPIGDNGKWARMGISALGGSCTFEASYTKSMYPDTTNIGDPTIDHVSAKEYWNLTKVAGTGAKVTLYYEDDDWSGIDTVCADELTVGHYNTTSSEWEDYDYDAGGMLDSTGWVRSAYATSFSPFAFAARGTRNPLPIELIEFKAILNDKKQTDINWVTASEVNNDYFTIEKSIDAINYSFVAEVKGNGTSTMKHEYNTLDKEPYKGVSYYRLKQTDYDGKFSYSKIVSVDNSNITTFDFNVYPNPASVNSEINLTLSGIESEKEIVVVLRDVLGKECYTKTFITTADNIYTINQSNLIPGIYYVVASNNNKLFSKKIVIK